MAKSRPAHKCHHVSRCQIIKKIGRTQTLSSALPLAISLALSNSGTPCYTRGQHSFLCTSCKCYSHRLHATKYENLLIPWWLHYFDYGAGGGIHKQCGTGQLTKGIGISFTRHRKGHTLDALSCEDLPMSVITSRTRWSLVTDPVTRLGNLCHPWPSHQNRYETW